MTAVEKTQTHKNWLEIAAEPNEALRLLLTETEDPRILAGLRTGFPHFFSESAEISAPPEVLPVSLLRTLSREEALRLNPNNPDAVETDTEFDWLYVIQKLRPDIPIFQFEDPVPRQFCRQLKGQTALGGMKVTYRSLKFIVVHVWTLDVGEIIAETPELECLAIAPAKFFDLTR